MSNGFRPNLVLFLSKEKNALIKVGAEALARCFSNKNLTSKRIFLYCLIASKVIGTKGGKGLTNGCICKALVLTQGGFVANGATPSSFRLPY